MRVLVIGSGGREHAICWKLSSSQNLDELFCAPGNPGISQHATLVPISVDNCEGLVHFAIEHSIDLVIVGPEYPLSLGIVDKLRGAKICVFGPSKEAARLESSKSFAKEIMVEAGVDTGRYEKFFNISEARKFLKQIDGPVVLKADGLASGKGVVVCKDRDQLENALQHVFSIAKDSPVLVEEFLEGTEASFIVATDGDRIIPLATSHDYKRLLDGDEGPNTGGMGSISPTPRLKSDDEKHVIENVIRPVLKTMEKRGVPFVGFLYAGLMITPAGIKVLEFNVRLGDPETQVILRRAKGDFLQMLACLASGTEQREEIQWSSDCAVCLVCASSGYPEKPIVGDVIQGLEVVRDIEDVLIFQAGTTYSGSNIVTNGGRVLNITATAPTFREVCDKVYKAAGMVNFSGMHFRKDIGLG